MGKNKDVKCQYKECPVSSSKEIIVAQTIFLVIAFGMLIQSSESFSPVSVIIFVGPQVVELCFCKTYTQKFKVLKVILLIVSFSIVVLCFFVLAKILIEDKGEYYLVSSTALFFASKKINKRIIAGMLSSIIGIPAITRLSMPEKNDEKIVQKYSRKEGVHI